MSNEEKMEIQRLPMLPPLAHKTMGEPNGGQWQASNSQVQLLSEVYKSIQVTFNQLYSTQATPDMLAQGMEFAGGMLLDIALVPPGEQAAYRAHAQDLRKSWFGLFSALLLQPDREDILREDYDMNAVLADETQPPFLRALAKSCGEQHPPVTRFTLYSWRLDDPDVEEWIPVAFSHSRMVTGICPAAQIRGRLKDAPPWYEFSSALGIGAFGDPAPTLSRPAYQARALAVYRCLGAFHKTCADPAMGEAVRESMLKLRSEIIPLEKVAVNRELLDLTETDEDASDAGEALTLLRSWVTDDLYLMRKSGEQDDFAGAIGRYRIEGDEEHYMLLPLGSGFAASWWNYLQTEEGAAAIGPGIGALERFLLEQMRVRFLPDEEGGAYQLTLSFEGKTYVKCYQGSHVVDTGHIVPVISVWPDTADDTGRWKRYYLYAAQLDQPEEPPLPLSFHAVLPEGTLASPDPNVLRSSFACADQAALSGVFPLFALVTQKKGNRRAEAGMVLPRPRDVLRHAKPQQPRCIGLDFGTSNTMAYYQDLMRRPGGTGEITAIDTAAAPRPLRLRDNLLKVTGFYQQAVEVVDPLNFLSLSADAAYEILPSMIYQHVERLDGEGIERAFLRSNIPFFQNVATIHDTVLDSLQMDLKWGDLKLMRDRASAYLEQMTMMYLFSSYRHDGRGNIHWCFSYPRSMNEARRLQFTRSLKNILDGFAAMDESAFAYTIRTYFESEALGSFITSDSMVLKMAEQHFTRVSPEAGFLCIDIGGGTVDLSLWQGENLSAEASLSDVAGNFVLCQTVTRNAQTGGMPRLELFRQLMDNSADPYVSWLHEKLRQLARWPEGGAAARDEESRRLISKWALFVEHVVAAMGQHAQSNAVIGPLQSYFFMIELYMMLLFHFSGMLLGQALRAGSFEAVDRLPFSIVLSGNGSKMLELIRFPLADSSRNRMDERLRFVFLKGCEATLGEPAPLAVHQIIPPIMAKHEVAYGLSQKSGDPGIPPAGPTSSPEASPARQVLDWTESNAISREGRGMVCAYLNDFWQALYEAHLHSPLLTLYDRNDAQSFLSFVRAVYPRQMVGVPTGEEALARLAVWTQEQIWGLKADASGDRPNTLTGVLARVINTLLMQSDSQDAFS